MPDRSAGGRRSGEPKTLNSWISGKHVSTICTGRGSNSTSAEACIVTYPFVQSFNMSCQPLDVESDNCKNSPTVVAALYFSYRTRLAPDLGLRAMTVIAVECGSRRKPGRSCVLSCLATAGPAVCGASFSAAGMLASGVGGITLSSRAESPDGSKVPFATLSSSRWYVASYSVVRSRRPLDGVSAYVSATGCFVTGLST